MADDVAINGVEPREDNGSVKVFVDFDETAAATAAIARVATSGPIMA